MHFQVKMPENRSNNILTGKKTTNKVPVMFLEFTVLTERQQLRFWTLSTNNQATVYLFSV